MYFFPIFFLVIFTIEMFCRKHDKTLLELLHPSWFKDVRYFPENDFKCKVDCPNYDVKVEEGYMRMREIRIVFTGLCINIESNVPSLIRRMEYLGQFFKDYRLVIFENDSSDNTRALLQQWTLQNPKIHLVPCEEEPNCRLKHLPAVQTGTFSASRMEKMAKFRNRTLKYTYQHFYDFDCICVLDLDIRGPISMNGLANSFGYYDLWDTISAFGLNGISLTMGQPVYYDLIAYKSPTIDINQNKLDIIPVLVKTNRHEVGSTPVNVTSGFAGLALYKMDIIRAGINYIPKDGKYICEHIIFNNNIRDAGFKNIYMNPSMILLVGPQGDIKNYPFY